ncbi:MAG: serine/threonine protein kinase [Acidobacteria bacterium]|nr:MAG: serine/threonine protein kinase [Acidobacteriota bacterium]
MPRHAGRPWRRVAGRRLLAAREPMRALVRAGLTLLVLAPFPALVAYLLARRERTVGEVLAGSGLVVVGLFLLLGVAGLLYRPALIEAVDQRLFRQRYRARRLLARLADRVAAAGDVEALERLLARGLERALGLERFALLIDDGDGGRLVDPRGEIRPLDLESPLVSLLLGERALLDVELEDSRSPVSLLPEPERHWLVDGRARLLAGTHGADGDLNGVLLFGAKKDESPIYAEERRLLIALAGATGRAIELLGLRARRDRRSPEEVQPGMECVRCERVFAAQATACEYCAQPLETSTVPALLPRKYRFERRIGSGGMAVVYRARDLRLGRTVAIKTLPRVSPEAAMRLRREARATARVSHPGLAAIYDLETWQGMPMLILELLEGGTLADRIAAQDLTPRDVIDTGMVVAQALQTIHDAGILHRDIKPSNIGYTRSGSAKLLDFGIARLESDLRRDVSWHSTSTSSWLGRDRSASTSNQLVGTISYLSPEALRGEPPSPAVDLWALSVVLYEATIGENLFYGPSLATLIERIRDADVPPVRERAPACPEPLADFFANALHRDKNRRPASGEAYALALGRVRRMLIQSDG